jgi:hypothetical protein
MADRALLSDPSVRWTRISTHPVFEALQSPQRQKKKKKKGEVHRSHGKRSPLRLTHTRKKASTMPIKARGELERLRQQLEDTNAVMAIHMQTADMQEGRVRSLQSQLILAHKQLELYRTGKDFPHDTRVPAPLSTCDNCQALHKCCNSLMKDNDRLRKQAVNSSSSSFSSPSSPRLLLTSSPPASSASSAAAAAAQHNSRSNTNTNTFLTALEDAGVSKEDDRGKGGVSQSDFESESELESDYDLSDFEVHDESTAQRTFGQERVFSQEHHHHPAQHKQSAEASSAYPSSSPTNHARTTPPMLLGRRQLQSEQDDAATMAQWTTAKSHQGLPTSPMRQQSARQQPAPVHHSQPLTKEEKKKRQMDLLLAEAERNALQASGSQDVELSGIDDLDSDSESMARPKPQGDWSNFKHEDSINALLQAM